MWLLPTSPHTAPVTQNDSHDLLVSVPWPYYHLTLLWLDSMTLMIYLTLWLDSKITLTLWLDCTITWLCDLTLLSLDSMILLYYCLTLWLDSTITWLYDSTLLLLLNSVTWLNYYLTLWLDSTITWLYDLTLLWLNSAILFVYRKLSGHPSNPSTRVPPELSKGHPPFPGAILSFSGRPAFLDGIIPFWWVGVLPSGVASCLHAGWEFIGLP